MRSAAIVAAAMIALGGCTAVALREDGAEAVVPYRHSAEGQLVVQTYVNGQGPFDFAVDTGASISVAFEKLCDSVELPRESGKQKNIHGLVASGRYPIITLDRLEVGPAIWSEVEVALLPADSPACATIEGILGTDILSRYAVGVFADERVLRLYPPQLVSERAYTGWGTIPIVPLGVRDGEALVYAIELTLYNKRVPAIFDLGAGLNMMNWRAARSIDLRKPKAVRREELKGAVETIPLAGIYTVDKLQAGLMYWEDVTFYISDVEVLAALGLDDRPTAIVGAGFFKGRDFIIDFERRRLLVRRSGGQGSGAGRADD